MISAHFVVLSVVSFRLHLYQSGLTKVNMRGTFIIFLFVEINITINHSLLQKTKNSYGFDQYGKIKVLA